MQIYADNAATTKTSRTAIDAMLPYFDQIYGNPSSLHHVGQAAAEALVKARQDIADCLGCEAREIYITSGGSEADNQAFRSAAYYGAKKGKKHIISTAFEHHAILHTLKQLEEEGFEVTLLDVHETGRITAQEALSAASPSRMGNSSSARPASRRKPRAGPLTASCWTASCEARRRQSACPSRRTLTRRAKSTAPTAGWCAWALPGLHTRSCVIR